MPSAWKYEYSGLMSRPLNGVISGLKIIAQSLPRRHVGGRAYEPVDARGLLLDLHVRQVRRARFGANVVTPSRDPRSHRWRRPPCSWPGSPNGWPPSRATVSDRDERHAGCPYRSGRTPCRATSPRPCRRRRCSGPGRRWLPPCDSPPSARRVPGTPSVAPHWPYSGRSRGRERPWSARPRRDVRADARPRVPLRRRSSAMKSHRTCSCRVGRDLVEQAGDRHLRSRCLRHAAGATIPKMATRARDYCKRRLMTASSIVWCAASTALPKCDIHNSCRDCGQRVGFTVSACRKGQEKRLHFRS